MDYLNIANSYVFYIVAVIIISFVIAQSVLLLRMALKRSKVVGISKKTNSCAMRRLFPLPFCLLLQPQSDFSL